VPLFKIELQIYEFPFLVTCDFTLAFRVVVIIDTAPMPVPIFHFAFDAVEQSSLMFLRRFGPVSVRAQLPPGSIYDPNMPEEKNQ
jgi:hypothetical protein